MAQQANKNGKKQRGVRGGRKPHPQFSDRTERQSWRHGDLMGQFRELQHLLAGRAAMLALPGAGCAHDSATFRPVHRQMPRWRSRPAYAILSVTTSSLTLSVASSAARDGKLAYFNGNGEEPCSFDFSQKPTKGARGAVLDGFVQHALFTCGNNLLQELVNSAEAPTGEFVLPEMLILTNCVKVDEQKLDALTQTVTPELRAVYRQKLKEDIGVMSLGQLFGKAALMPDTEIAKAFSEQRVYEDFSLLLGSNEINPARKVLAAHNPARQILTEAGCKADWAENADQSFVESALLEMRARLPLPERATDSDLYQALLEPDSKINFSVPMADLPRAAIVNAMRSAMPFGAAIRHVVTDAELVAAALDPYGPMTVGRYGKVQVFKTEDMRLPTYATGGFFAAPRTPVTLELA